MIQYPTQSTAYGWLMLAGIIVSIGMWSRLARKDSRLLIIYLGGLAGAFVGAKVVYLAAEGWMQWHAQNRWVLLATGKSILGGLLGGYLAVEISKNLLGYERITGDLFAVVVPVGIMLGRVGCMLHGCCLGHACEPGWFTVTDASGVSRWPAAHVELAFNAIAFLILLLLRQKRFPLLQGQLFHCYLIGYGLFRLAHEHWRETSRWLGPVTGYQFFAVLLVALGTIRFWQRRNLFAVSKQSPLDAHD
jgi:phosphatidylglycerol:prolipoprotein diacylglycerol transferase